MSKLSTLVTIFALLLIISSALLSYFLVSKNQQEISILQQGVVAKQNLIRDIWSNIGQIQNKIDTALIVSILADKDNTNAQQLKTNYLSIFHDLDENANFDQIISHVSQNKNKSLEYIDNVYIEQLQLLQDINEMESSNRLYSDLAFFLQTIGLVLLILRKDIPA